MSIEMVRVSNESSFLDPMKNFELKKVTSELRYDPLTGMVSRIFPFRKFKLPRHDWTPFVEESRKKFCPFCPDVLEKVTPKFTADISAEGRIKVGGATVVPNINPYEKYAALVVMSPRHYIPMDELSIDLMVESFRAGLEYLQIVAKIDPEGARYASINWNYMPYSGGSLIHPHLQVLAGKEPSTYDKKLIVASNQYAAENNSNYWQDLIDLEMKNGERYIGATGSVHWLSAFAPRHVGEVLGIIPNKRTVDDLTDSDLAELAAGLQKVVNFYNSSNIVSFNAALYFAAREDKGFALHARLVGRFTIFPLVGSDISHMQILHDDPWTVILPEDFTRDLINNF